MNPVDTACFLGLREPLARSGASGKVDSFTLAKTRNLLAQYHIRCHAAQDVLQEAKADRVTVAPGRTVFPTWKCCEYPDQGNSGESSDAEASCQWSRFCAFVPPATETVTFIDSCRECDRHELTKVSNSFKILLGSAVQHHHRI